MITVFYHPNTKIPLGPGTGIQVGVDQNQQQACTDYYNGQTNLYYIDTSSFSTATVLAIDDQLNTLTLPGFYSDGINVRYWSGSSFTSTNLCLQP